MQSRSVKEHVERTLRGILSLKSVESLIDDCCDFANFKAFRADYDPEAARLSAIDALSEFFLTTSPLAASAVLAKVSDPALAMFIANENLRAAKLTDAVVEQVMKEVTSRTRIPASKRVIEKAAEMVETAIEKRMAARDDSKPIDFLNDEDLVVCYIPGFHSGMSFASTLTNHDDEDSNPESIIPNEALARFLKLVNVSSDEYLDLVKAETGVDLRSEPGSLWGDFHVDKDEAKESLISGDAIIDGIYGSPFGFSPLVAFRANPRFLIERDWSQPLQVTGGMIGFHNFINGSGNPQRFEGTLSIKASPSEFIVGEGRRFGLDECYGFGRKAFQSTVMDDVDQLQPSLA